MREYIASVSLKDFSSASMSLSKGIPVDELKQLTKVLDLRFGKNLPFLLHTRTPSPQAWNLTDLFSVEVTERQKVQSTKDIDIMGKMVYRS